MSHLRKKYIENTTSSDNESVNSSEIKLKKSKSKKLKNDTIIKSKSKIIESESESKSESEVISIKSNKSNKSNRSTKLKVTKLTDEELLESYNSILKQYWGYDGLKSTQFDIIKKVLIEKKDICAILATGFGKSLCYQLPYLILKKCIIVVSPLIALMHEQGQDMENKKIPVAIFNSDTKNKRKNEMQKEILDGNNKLIYMTPEYLIKCEDFIKELDNELAFICIDEAHAISTWGLDFRSSYTKLGVLREWVPTIPILTLTATASTKVQEDISKILNLSNPEFIIGNFDRPNLLIRVQPRHDDIMINISELLEKYSNEYIIIYCKTRDETDELAKKINNILKINCASYHAGMSDVERQLVQQNFIDGECKCIIATIAFGMGINIPNVRLVVHYNCPKNMESYYQEIGRAGRDGKPSECVLFYSAKDFKINRYFLQSITNPIQKVYQENQIKQIEKYVFSTECRRKIILQSFSQVMESCTNCDNCISKIKKEPQVEKCDYTIQVYMLLNILVKINNKFGTGMLINILLGRKSKVKEWMINYSEYGSGSIYGNEDFWKNLIRCMINNELIEENQSQGSFFTTIGLTNNGSKLRTNLYSKYPKYADLTLAQNDDNSSNSYIKYQVNYPVIETNIKKIKVNKSVKKYR
jgi:RecQ family ATP-dependent DNA helicase